MFVLKGLKVMDSADLNDLYRKIDPCPSVQTIILSFILSYEMSLFKRATVCL